MAILEFLGLPDTPTERVIGPARLKICTLPDNNGWIEVGNRRWAVQYHPRSQWNNSADEYCADYWVIGNNGKRHNYLLIAPDGHCATRSELNAHYHSEHVFSRNRAIKKRRKILDDLELTRIDAANLDLHFVPLSEKPPRGIHWKIWERRQAILHGQDVVLVRRPEKMRVKRMMKLLRYLNKPHRGRGDGKDTVAELERLFGH